MVILPHNRSAHGAVAALAQTRALPNVYDLAAVAIIAALIILVAHGAIGMRASLEALSRAPVSLDVAQLPEYALRTTLRMFAAIFASLLFTFVVAALAAKSRRAELMHHSGARHPAVGAGPRLSHLHRELLHGLCFPAASSAPSARRSSRSSPARPGTWPFSFYQSLRTVPRDLDEASPQLSSFRPGSASGGWRCRSPTPGLVWNTMMSMSGGWFFVVASEAITVGDTTVSSAGHRLLSRARHRRSRTSPPSVGPFWRWRSSSCSTISCCSGPSSPGPTSSASSRRPGRQRPRSWVLRLAPAHALDRTADGAASAGLGNGLMLVAASGRQSQLRIRRGSERATRLHRPRLARAGARRDGLRRSGQSSTTCRQTLAWRDVLQAFGCGLATLLRVVVLIAVASLIWVPIGVWIGLRPALAERVQPLAQFLAAFPANLLFPVRRRWRSWRLRRRPQHLAVAR